MLLKFYKNACPLTSCNYLTMALETLNLLFTTPISYDMWTIVLCQSQSIDNQYCGWIGPCDSYYGCNTPSAITIRKLKKTKCLLTTGLGNYMASWVWGVGSGETQARSSAFIEVQSGGLRFQGLTLDW